MTDQPDAAPTLDGWMLHDMEFATVVTAEKPGLFIALCDSAAFTRKENLAHAELIAAAPETAAERDRLKVVNEGLVALLREALPHVKSMANSLTLMTGPIVGPVDRLASEIQAALDEARQS